MSIGEGAKPGVNSYIALFIENTFGSFPSTAATGASTLEPLSCSFKTEIESQKLDQISRNRGFSKRVQLNKNVAGSLEQYLHPTESPILFALSLGGGLTTTPETTTGATFWTHSIASGNFDGTIASISCQVRKGDTHHWQYTGGKVNTLKISGNVGELINVSYEFVFKDSTQTGSDISGDLSISAVLPFTFVGGKYRYAATEGSLTSTVEEYIQNFELNISNNIISDTNARALGSNVPQVLPATRRNVELKITQRFDTTTQWDRFIAATQGAAELYFEGSSITATQNQSCRIRMPKIFLNSPDPEISGPNDILSSEISFDVVIDEPSTSTGKDLGITFVNDVSSY